MAAKVVLEPGSREAAILKRLHLATIIAGGRWANRSIESVESAQRELSRFGLADGVDDLQAAFLREVPVYRKAFGQLFACLLVMIVASVRENREKTDAQLAAIAGGAMASSKKIAEDLLNARPVDAAERWKELAVALDLFCALTTLAQEVGETPLPVETGLLGAIGRWTYGLRMAAPGDMASAMQETLAEMSLIQVELRAVIAEMEKA
jgi:hypothetical protein